jgi:hypothetical protein
MSLKLCLMEMSALFMNFGQVKQQAGLELSA